MQLHGSDDDWEPFLDAVAGEANHAPPARRRKLDAALHEVELARDAQRRARPAPQGRPATIPELTRRAAAREAERFCDDRVPARVRHQVRLEVDESDMALTIVERRVPWNAKNSVEAEDWTRMPIAVLRWFDDHVWRLFYCDSRDRWHLDTDAPASATVGDLPRHLNEDKTGIYWG